MGQGVFSQATSQPTLLAATLCKICVIKLGLLAGEGRAGQLGRHADDDRPHDEGGSEPPRLGSEGSGRPLGKSRRRPKRAKFDPFSAVSAVFSTDL